MKIRERQKTEMKQGLKWWQKTIVYEIYLNSFLDSDGIGPDQWASPES